LGVKRSGININEAAAGHLLDHKHKRVYETVFIMNNTNKALQIHTKLNQ